MVERFKSWLILCFYHLCTIMVGTEFSISGPHCASYTVNPQKPPRKWLQTSKILDPDSLCISSRAQGPHWRVIEIAPGCSTLPKVWSTCWRLISLYIVHQSNEVTSWGVPWGKMLDMAWSRLINLGNQPRWLQSTRHSLPCWHGKRGSRQAVHDWLDEKVLRPTRQCIASARETSVQAGDTVQARAWSSVPKSHPEQGLLFPSTPSIVQAPFPACCDHATAVQVKALGYFNALSTQPHLQNIQPEASAACCSLTGCTLGAI